MCRGLGPDSSAYRVRVHPLHHQTLHATLEWSYTLLPAVEQRLLVRLSVFSGDWTLAAAEEVAGTALDRLSQLVLYCDVMGSFRTGKALFAQAAVTLQTEMTNSTNQSTLQPLWAQVFVRFGVCEVMLTDIAQGEQHLQDVLLLGAADRERALALLYLGFAATDRGDLTLAHAYLQESLAISQRCNDFAGMADALLRFSELSKIY